MSVYVDKLIHWGWRLGPSCHLFADTEGELHAFAKSIGLRRSWFQPKSFPHYDLTKRRREAAVARGAVELDRAGLRALLRRMRTMSSDVGSVKLTKR